MFLTYQATSVDATAPGAFSRFMLSFWHPPAFMQTCLHPWHQREKNIKATANNRHETGWQLTRRSRREDDEAHVCFSTNWKSSSIGQATVVDRGRGPERDGVHDATLVLSISSSSWIRASSLCPLSSYRIELEQCDSQHPGNYFLENNVLL